MHSLGGLALRGIRRRPLRNSLTVLGIALGVGLLFAALATDAGVEAAAERTVRETAGSADLAVRAAASGGIDASGLAAIAATEGIAEVSPEVRRRTFAVDLARGLDEGMFGPVTVVGVDPATTGRFHDYAMVGGSFIPAAGGDAGDGGPDGTPTIVIPSAWAATWGIELGERISLLGTSGEKEFRVVGLLGASGPALADAGRAVFIPIADARALFGLGEAVDAVEARLAPGNSVPVVRERLEQRMAPGSAIIVPVADQVAVLGASTRDLRSNAILIAAVALFVGGFLVFSTLSMTVSERTREIGLLRAAGATPSQVDLVFLREALMLAALGTAAGLAVGFVGAEAMSAAIRATRDAPAGGPVYFPGPLVVAVVLGLLVTILAAIGPARRAGRVAPIEALRAHGQAEAGTGERARWLVVTAAVMALAVVLLTAGPASTGTAGAAGDTGGVDWRLLRPLMLFGILVVAVLAAPAALRAASSAASALSRSVLRAEGRLAAAALRRDERRTAVSLGALVVGIAAVVSVAVLSADDRRIDAAWTEGVVPGEYVATAIAPIPADFAADFAAVDGVDAVTPLRTFEVQVAGRRVDGLAVDPAQFAGTAALEVRDVPRADAFAALEAGGAVLVPASLAGGLGARLGETVLVRTTGGDRPFRVAGFVARSYPGEDGESLVFSAADAEAWLGAAGANVFAIARVPDAPASLRSDLETAAQLYALDLNEVGNLGGAVRATAGRSFGLLDGLALVAVLVAALGIANTLAMGVYERVREIGVLRAVGMTRRQVWWMVVLEAAMLGVVGAGEGVLAGLAVGAAAALIGRPAGLPPLGIPWPEAALAFVLGVSVAILAAAYPARLAGRLLVVQAARTD